jgi:HD-GYP domain-containing protein (c-di-GMP phosphodiesterase class II)/pSer/pThr/pTyr-binding forkhead associated (FHA) protein
VIHLRGADPVLQGKRWESASRLRIGRLKELEIVLDDASVSRRHAEVAFTEHGWVVRDLGSTNGTFVNGTRIGRIDQKLRLLDQLRIGNVNLTVAGLESDEAVVETQIEDGIQVRESVRNSWDQAFEAVAELAGPDPCAQHRLQGLLRVGRDFAHCTSLDGVIQQVLGEAQSALHAERGVILLVNETTSQLVVRVSAPASPRCPEGAPSEAWVSHRLAQRALGRGESLLCEDGLPEQGSPPASVLCALLRSPRKRLGVIYLLRGPEQPPFTPDDLRLADVLAASVSAGVESLGHFIEKERELFIHTLTALAQAVDLRDDYTGSHTQRVTDYALLLGDELNLSQAERYHLQVGTPLHDIGKIGIKDAILLKQGRLTEEEFNYMKSHTWKGAAMLEVIPHLRPIVPIVRNHHERWDGRGYPDMLAGDRIPFLGRIVAVADTFDAMTTDRPYRPGLSPDRAFEEILAKAGTQFDPCCVAGFMRLRDQLKVMLGEQKMLVQTTPFVREASSLMNANARRTVALSAATLERLRQAIREREEPAPPIRPSGKSGF